MKNFIIWLADLFNANLTKEIVVYKEIKVFIPENGVYNGSLSVKGDLIVEGELKVKGEITCHGSIKQ